MSERKVKSRTNAQRIALAYGQMQLGINGLREFIKNHNDCYSSTTKANARIALKELARVTKDIQIESGWEDK